ncbi:unnamed protein product [Rhizoctonia solani]|uniref:Transmembrane protein n=1 Tax=Rhizoctonia solani TaxID=456999 RepID=A0A8H3I0K2_9AGAM|nr:unnamed protein product [Rhizoctonia solani]
MARAPETVFYPTYNPPYSPYHVNVGSPIDTDVTHDDSKRSDNNQSEKRSDAVPDTNVVRGPWWMLSFEKRSSLVLSQLGYYILASGSAASVAVGCVEGWRGAFDAHREWMLRAWLYNGALVTTHAAVVISARIIALIHGYYSHMRCSEIRYLVSSDRISQDFPQCSTPEAIANPDSHYLVVKATWDEGKVGQSSAIRASFGMSILLAIFLHSIGVEIYIRVTRGESEKLQELSRQRRIRAHESSVKPYMISSEH